MKTLFSIALLVVIGIIANFAMVFILNIVGIPGALIAGSAGEGYVNRGKFRYIFGTIVSTLGQSYIYLAYTAFIVNWTLLAVSKQGVNFIIWLIAFLVVIIPIWLSSVRARAEGKEGGYINAQIEALPITLFISFAGFLIFAFVPRIMEIIYNWVPYIGS